MIEYQTSEVPKQLSTKVCVIVINTTSSDQPTSRKPARLYGALERRDGGALEDLAHAVARLCRAFDEGERRNVIGHRLALLARHRLQLLPAEFAFDVRIGAQVCLRADEDDGDLRAEVPYLRQPLLGDVAEAVRVGDAVADEDDVRVRVGEWSGSQRTKTLRT